MPISANYRQRLLAFPLLFVSISILTGCNVLGTGTTSNPAPKLTVTVKPATAQVRAGDTQQFTATLSTAPASQIAAPAPQHPDVQAPPPTPPRPPGQSQVKWSVNGVPGGNSTVGTISAKGLYTAPGALPSSNMVHVSASSSEDAASTSESSVSLENPIPVVSAVSPTTVNVGSFSLTITGKKFVYGATVVFGGQFLSTTFVSPTQLMATGSATQQQVGTVSVDVQNPDPGSSGSGTLSVLVASPANQVSAQVAARFLDQSTWGPTPQLISHVQQIGLQAFLNEQFNAPISTYPAPGPKDDVGFVEKRFFLNAMQGPDQLRQRVAFALSEIFVISAQKINNPNAFTLWMNMMQNDASGNYQTLLKDVSLSPSMGYYLDIGNNDGCNGCAPNENYAREVMQLFSIGLAQLNPDGSVQTDGSGNPIPTYTQNTIEGFSSIFTGWTYPPTPGSQNGFYNQPYFSGPMIAFDNHHDSKSKLLLNGTTVPAGGTTTADLTAGVQNIFNHPNVGPFICKQLIFKLVTSNPSPAYISRVVAVFNDNGSGVRGDLKAVITAILMDPDARRGDDPAQVQSTDGHLREPLLFMLSVMRAANATTDGGDNLRYYASNMRQEPFNSPTVFNFYPPTYKIPGTQLLGPEFKLLNTSTSIARINFVNDLVYGNIGQNTKIDLSPYLANAADPNALMDSLSAVLLHGQMSDSARSTVANALSQITDPKRRTKAAFYLIAGSSQFQVQH